MQHAIALRPTSLRLLAALAAALLAATLAPVPPAAAGGHDGDHDAPPRECVPGAPDGYERVVDLTFPVAGPVTFIDDYHQPRSGGRRHQATDLVGEKLQRVHAALGGVVTVATGIDGPMPSYGYYLKIAHDNGLASAYVHLNNDTPGTDDGQGGPEWAYAPGIRKGVRVERGQWIGYLGDSGNAEQTVPHLHFELFDPSVAEPEGAWDPCLDDDSYRDKTRLNPYPSLLDAQRRGDVPAPPPEATPETAVERIAGSNRVLTAVAISQRFEPGVRAVIVVPEGTHAEALVAAPLAGLLDSPVLLAGRDGLAPAVIDEVRRLDARSAYVIGRSDQLGARTEDDLRAAGVSKVARIAEADPFALSARVAAEIASYDRARTFERVLLAVGEHDEEHRAWPDALSAGALAATLKVPVLLTRGDALPEPVRALLAEQRPGRVQVVGGVAAVSEAVAQAAATAAGAAYDRLAGSNRFATSVAVAAEAVAVGLSAPLVWAATGHAFPDALAAAPAAARAGAPLLLVDGRQPGGAPEPEAWLAEQSARLEHGVVVGGAAAVSEDVRRRLAAIIAGT